MGGRVGRFEYMPNNIKIRPKKVRILLVYLEVILRNVYLCPRFQDEGLDYQILFLTGEAER